MIQALCVDYIIYQLMIFLFLPVKFQPLAFKPLGFLFRTGATAVARAVVRIAAAAVAAAAFAPGDAQINATGKIAGGSRNADNDDNQLRVHELVIRLSPWGVKLFDRTVIFLGRKFFLWLSGSVKLNNSM